MFGQAVSVDAIFGFQMKPVQILYLCLLGTAGNTLTAIVDSCQRSRLQPSTYGHLPTIVNLVDRWYPKLYWGDKSAHVFGIGHSGTSDRMLPNLDPNRKYGGIECVGCRGH